MIPYSILLIDDDPVYCRQLQEAARGFRFHITVFHNLEEGMKELRKSRRIKAIILDDRCVLQASQQGAGKSNFVIHAIQQLKDIEHEYKRSIPYCVNCVIKDEFREDLEGVTQLFVKKQDHDQMFNWLKDSIDQMPETAIRREFYGVFEKVSAVFNEDHQELLIEVLQNRGIADSTTIVTNLIILRLLMEILVDAVCLKKLGRQPDDFVNGQNGSRTRQILEAMQPQILPSELFIQATQLYKTCSKYGNHPPPYLSANRFSPTPFTVTRLVYTFLEIADHLLPSKISSSSQTSSQPGPAL